MIQELMFSLAWAFFQRRAIRHAEEANHYAAQRGSGWSVTVQAALNDRAAASAARLHYLNKVR